MAVQCSRNRLRREGNEAGWRLRQELSKCGQLNILDVLVVFAARSAVGTCVLRSVSSKSARHSGSVASGPRLRQGRAKTVICAGIEPAGAVARIRGLLLPGIARHAHDRCSPLDTAIRLPHLEFLNDRDLQPGSAASGPPCARNWVAAAPVRQIRDEIRERGDRSGALVVRTSARDSQSGSRLAPWTGAWRHPALRHRGGANRGHEQQLGPQHAVVAGFVARTNALMNVPSTSFASATASRPSAARKVRASSMV